MSVSMWDKVFILALHLNDEVGMILTAGARQIMKNPVGRLITMHKNAIHKK